MYPILGRYGPFFLYSFTVSWIVGLLVGLLVSYRLASSPKKANVWLDPVLIAGIFAILSGRFAFIWLNANYFQTTPNEWWQIQQGGLAYHGVVLGGLLALYLWSRFKPLAWASLTSLVVIFHITGWFACYLEGCGYGLPTSPSWLVGELPDTFGVIDLRYQVQIIAIAIFLLLLLWVVWARRSRVAGKLQWWCVWLVVGVVNAGISPLRADLVYSNYNIQINLFISILATIALISNLKSPISTYES